MNVKKIKKTALFVAFFIIVGPIFAQLTVAPYNSGTGNNGAGANLTTFIQNNLIGTGVTISNVTFVGANRQMGSFNSENTVLYSDEGLDKGIILSTGEAKTAIGPNNSPYACVLVGILVIPIQIPT